MSNQNVIIDISKLLAAVGQPAECWLCFRLHITSHSTRDDSVDDSGEDFISLDVLEERTHSRYKTAPARTQAARLPSPTVNAVTTKIEAHFGTRAGAALGVVVGEEGSSGAGNSSTFIGIPVRFPAPYPI